VKPTDDSLRFDTNEAGGAGMVLNGVNIAPFGENHLAIRARLLPDNEAKTLVAKVIPDGSESVQVGFDLTKLKEDRWTTLYLPLGAGTFTKISQIQFQGSNFGGGSPLRLDIDKIGTAKLAASAPLVVD
ncbi:hypothetical protein, partial [Escherichia coli]|uniref:hypothetical protein n=1 Tax=Escherichia coli TaxID=562 RepID=UPI0022ABF780